jgi:hypothetical protein
MMSKPISKDEKMRRILAALEGRAAPKPGKANTAGNIVGIMDRSEKSSSKVIVDFVDENPDKALAVFRNWMAE